MPGTSRTWSPLDNEVADFFSELRSNMPYRKLAEISGIKFSRVMDLLNKRHGTPTLEEFTSLCLSFDRVPSDTLDMLIKRVALKEQDNSDSPKQDIGISDDLTLAANRDPNKKLESEYEDWGA